MSLWDVAVDFERWIQSFFRKKLSGSSELHQLEIRQAILNEVESKVQPVGNGVRVLPYQLLVIYLHAQDDDRRDFLERSFVEKSRLRDDIYERLRQSGCQADVNPAVQLKFTVATNPEWQENGFHIEYRRQIATGRRPSAKLTVVTGQATQEVFKLTKNNLKIGRMQDVKDQQGHIVRRNDLVFLEIDDDVNQSVSRAHAHIWFDDVEGVFRLCDDNSAQGTYIFRNDRTTEVPRNSTRGTKLRSDDKIHFGKATVVFKITRRSSSK